MKNNISNVVTTCLNQPYYIQSLFTNQKIIRTELILSRQIIDSMDVVSWFPARYTDTHVREKMIL